MQHGILSGDPRLQYDSEGKGTRTKSQSAWTAISLATHIDLGIEMKVEIQSEFSDGSVGSKTENETPLTRDISVVRE